MVVDSFQFNKNYLLYLLINFSYSASRIVNFSFFELFHVKEDGTKKERNYCNLIQ